MVEAQQLPAPPAPPAPPKKPTWPAVVDAVSEVNRQLTKSGSGKRVVVEQRGDGFQYRWASPTYLQPLSAAEIAEIESKAAKA